MYKVKLCLGLSSQFKLEYEDQIRLLHKTGFEGFFTNWDVDFKACRKLADELGMVYQSVHAPYANSANMWKNNHEAEEAVNELLKYLEETAKINVPIMVVHTYIGFGPNDGPNEYGIKNYGKIVDRAKELGVKIAFENTEGDEYLAALMDAFKERDNVGFCWDTGHEQCYNRGNDMMALYGDRLIATHFNDNLGIRDFNGEITWIDDLHLLPFDGITDWQSVANRLNKYNYNGILTFELNTLSKPDRHENDKYNNMKIEEYIAEVYIRACRLANLMNK